MPRDLSILAGLDATNFERLVTRLLWRWGFYNVQRIGGPGDRGRDLTAQTVDYPLPGRQIVRDWLIQCKFWKMAPSRSRLREGLDSAIAHNANYYLLAGTFSVSPGLADWLDEIRAHYPFDLLIVSGDELDGWISAMPDVAYDFLGSDVKSFPYTALMESLVAELGPRAQAGPEFLATLSLGMSLCRILKSPIFNSVHVLLAINLRRASLGNTVLERSGVRSGAFATLFKDLKTASELTEGQSVSATENVRRSIAEAGRLAALHHQPTLVDDIDLLSGLVRQNPSGALKILRAARVDVDRLCAEIVSTRQSAGSKLRTPDLWDLSVLNEGDA